MKKIHLLLIAFVASLQVKGQIIQIQGGPSFSKFSWSSSEPPKGLEQYGRPYTQNNTGFAIFLGLDYWEQHNFKLSSNVGLVRKGGSSEFVVTDVKGTPLDETLLKRATLHYISFNTMCDINFPLSETVSPYIGVGPG